MNKQIIQALALKNFSEAKQLVFKFLYAKSALALDEARLEVASSVFNTLEEVDESLATTSGALIAGDRKKIPGKVKKTTSVPKLASEIDAEHQKYVSSLKKEETEVQESNMKEIDTDRLLKKWRKDHVSNFHLRKAKEKASRSPEQVKKDADSDAYSAAHVKKTGKRLGRID